MGALITPRNEHDYAWPIYSARMRSRDAFWFQMLECPAARPGGDLRELSSIRDRPGRSRGLFLRAIFSVPLRSGAAAASRNPGRGRVFPSLRAMPRYKRRSFERDELRSRLESTPRRSFLQADAAAVQRRHLW